MKLKFSCFFKFGSLFSLHSECCNHDVRSFRRTVSVSLFSRGRFKQFSMEVRFSVVDRLTTVFRNWFHVLYGQAVWLSALCCSAQVWTTSPLFRSALDSGRLQISALTILDGLAIKRTDFASHPSWRLDVFMWVQNHCNRHHAWAVLQQMRRLQNRPKPGLQNLSPIRVLERNTVFSNETQSETPMDKKMNFFVQSACESSSCLTTVRENFEFYLVILLAY